MPYSAFTFNKVKKDFQLTVVENQDLFSDTAVVTPTDYLNMILAEHLPLVTAINTEKARSELVIMPVLIEVRRYLQYQVSVFSGSEFNVDAAQGLEGRCDFILCKSPEQYDITSPVVTIVEAKNESIKSGLGQCIATMIAANLFNQQQGNVTNEIYGVVTTGTDWKFLKLCNSNVFIDKKDYFIKEVDKILGILSMSLSNSTV
ncbi:MULTISPECIES: hypothetical protein [Nostocales]|uniref:hypothetical protein n=1 Tax=Nostocales TaxID=1161 RepID=UPI0016888130|nr:MULTISPECIES: hypothetical protein [Nostocales]MBD2299450.1 hypothetical protein [Nostoc sp. FACHB-190]MBD2490655.1 hypothetical protein [Aulosira sp. FACHB-615]